MWPVNSTQALPIGDVDENDPQVIQALWRQHHGKAVTASIAISFGCVWQATPRAALPMISRRPSSAPQGIVSHKVRGQAHGMTHSFVTVTLDDGARVRCLEEFHEGDRCFVSGSRVQQHGVLPNGVEQALRKRPRAAFGLSRGLGRRIAR